jgi:hypothetical protein
LRFKNQKATAPRAGSLAESIVGIYDCHTAAGTYITVADLAQRMGISRSTVTSALKRWRGPDPQRSLWANAIRKQEQSIKAGIPSLKRKRKE